MNYTYTAFSIVLLLSTYHISAVPELVPGQKCEEVFVKKGDPLKTPEWFAKDERESFRARFGRLMSYTQGRTALYEFWKSHQYAIDPAQVKLDSPLATEESSYSGYTVGVGRELSKVSLRDTQLTSEALWMVHNTFRLEGKNESRRTFVYNPVEGKPQSVPLVDLKQGWVNRNTIHIPVTGVGVPYWQDNAGHRDQWVTVEWAQDYLGRLEGLGVPEAELFKKYVAAETKEPMFLRREDSDTKWCKQPHPVDPRDNSLHAILKKAGLVREDNTIHDSVVLLAHLCYEHPGAIDSMQPPIRESQQ